MSRITYDFTIVSNTTIPGVALVMAQNEEAWNYICDEQYAHLEDGSVPIWEEAVGDFISDAGHSKFSSNLV